jgi:5'-nucleotidase
MRILLTNDDGIHAPGLVALERIAHALTDDVWVVAPELDQSGLSHSLSLNDPLRLREVAEKKFAVRGTPSDCVIMGLRRILADGKPDLVLSGVNSGTNIADDVTYSGTIAGAIEGTMLGIPSIAMSQGYPAGERARIPYETSVEHGPRVVQALIDFGFPDNILYNVNFPNRSSERVEGVRVAAQGRLAHGLHVEERFDGRGNQYFWLAYRRGEEQAVPAGSDIEAVAQGFISVTALRLDLTAHDLADPLRHHFARRG